MVNCRVTRTGANGAEKTPKPCNRTDSINIPAQPAATETRFAVVGDTGKGCDPKDKNSKGQCLLAKQMEQIQRQFGFTSLFLLGDNIYEFGNPNGIRKKIYDPYDELSKSGVVIRGVLGNHDVLNYKGSGLQMKFFNSKDSEEQRRFFKSDLSEQFGFPGNADRYYSISENKGLVEFFALDSSMLTRQCCGIFFWKRKFTKEETNAQVDWLRKRLTASTARWKIVMLHHPFYSSALGHGVKAGADQKQSIPKQMSRLRVDQDGWDNIEKILVEGGVDLVLAGHDHVYERIEKQKGVAHFVSGAGATLRENDFDTTLPAFHECGESRKLSFMFFSVKQDSISFWTIGVDGKALDHGTIK